MPGAFEKHIGVYMSYPVFIEAHQHKSRPIGKCVDMQFRDDGIWAKFQLANTQTGDELLTLFHEGCLRGFSAGFVPVVVEENPSLNKIPSDALKTANGRRVKKLYHEVELVEISALAIPSNRRALVDNLNKGNQVAGVVIKMFDAKGNKSKIEMIVKEWIKEKEKEESFYGFVTKGAGLVYASQYGPQLWHSLTGGPSITAMGGTSNVAVNVPQAQMDAILRNQQEILSSLQQVKDKDSWAEWAKKWGLRLGGAAAGYLFLTRTQIGQGMVQAAKEKLKDWIVAGMYGVADRIRRKGIDTENQVQTLTDTLDIIADALEKGVEVGADKIPEYKDLSNQYQQITDEIKDLVEEKGFAAFIGKGMTEAQFEEAEHPRHADGKFRPKGEAAKPSTVGPKSVTQSMSPKKVKEVEKPKAVKYRTVSSSVVQPGKSRELSEEEKKGVVRWIRANKGKTALVGLGIASAPLIFATARVGGRLIKTIYSDAAKKMVPWDGLTPEAKAAWRNQAQPGDVFIWGSRPYDGIEDLIGDTYKHVAKGDETARRRLREVFAKAVNGGSYSHSSMIVGTYDQNMHKKMVEAYMSGGVRHKRARDLFVNMFGQEGKRVVVNDLNIKKYMENKKYIDEILTSYEGEKIETIVSRELDRVGDLKFKTNKQKKLFWNDVKDRAKYVSDFDDFLAGRGIVGQHMGKFVVAQATSGEKGRLVLSVKDYPRSTPDAISLILRPKKEVMSLSDKKAMGERIIEDALNEKQSGIRFTFDQEQPTTLAMARERPDLVVDRLADPITGSLFTAIVKDDRVICAGTVAELYKNYGGEAFRGKFKKESALLYPKDLLSSKKFADVVLPAGSDKWIKPEELEKMRPLPKAVIATGAVGGAVVAGSEAKKKLEKGFADFVGKEMTKEEFDPREHPRAPAGSERGGEFVKAGTGVTTTAPKRATKFVASHGGVRAGAGRMPKKAPQAVQRLTEKYKAENPGMSEAKVKEKIRADAYRLGKPDWILYMDDPVKYMDKEREDMANALRSSYNRARTSSGVVEQSPVNAKDAHGIMDASLSKFNEEVQKHKAVADAWKKYRSDNVSDEDRAVAKILLAGATLAGAATLAAIFWKRPRYIPNKFFRAVDISKTAAKEIIRGGKGTGEIAQVRRLSAINKFAMGEVVAAELIQSAKIGPFTSWGTIDAKQVNFLNRWIASAVAKLKGKTGGKAIRAYRLGPTLRGYGLEGTIYGPGKGAFVNTKVKQDLMNWRPRQGSLDGDTGIVFVGRNGKVQVEDLLTSAWERAYWNKDGKLQRKILELVPKESTDPLLPFEWRGRRIVLKPDLADTITKAERHAVEISNDVTPEMLKNKKLVTAKAIEAKTNAWLEGHGIVIRKSNGDLEFTRKHGIIPDYIYTPYTPDEINEYDKALGRLDPNKPDRIPSDWGALGDFFMEKVIPPFSVRAWAGIGATTGAAGTAFYFHKDIMNFVKEVTSSKKEKEAISTALRKEEGKAEKQEKPNLAEWTKYERALAEKERRRAEAYTAQGFQQDIQERLVSKLVGEHLRREMEGAVPLYRSLLATIERYLPNLALAALQEEFARRGFKAHDPRVTAILLDLMKDDKKLHQVTAQALVEYIKNPKHKKDIENLAEAGKILQEEIKKQETKRGDDEWYGEYDAQIREGTKKGFVEFITKGMNEEEKPLQGRAPSADDLATAMAEVFIDDLVDCSDACKIAIENALPGHTRFEAVLDVLNDVYSALRNQVKLVKNGPGEEDIVKKEMSKEEFVESEHPRHRDGKFRDKNSVQEGVASDVIMSDKTKKIVGGVVVIGGVALSVGAYKILRNSNIFARAGGNTSKAQKIAIGVLSGSAIGKNATTTAQSILDIKVFNEIKNFNIKTYRRRFPEKAKVIDYINNPLGFQKDLMRQFGHLESPGPVKIVIRDEVDYGGSLDSALGNQIAFIGHKNTLNINLVNYNFPEAVKVIDSMGGPKELLMHEWGHALTLLNTPGARQILKKTEADFVKAGLELKGKKFSVRYIHPSTGIDTKSSGIISDVKVVDFDYGEFGMSRFPQLEGQFGKLSDDYVRVVENQKGFIQKRIVITTKEDNGEVAEFELITLPGLFGQIFNGIPAEEVFAVEGIKNSRDIYRLASQSEWCSVLSERGIKL
jgi:phage head maturation protease